MFHLNHAACRVLVKASPEVIKEVDKQQATFLGGTEEKSPEGDQTRRKVSSGNMPRFLYTDTEDLMCTLQVFHCISQLIVIVSDKLFL